MVNGTLKSQNKLTDTPRESCGYRDVKIPEQTNGRTRGVGEGGIKAGEVDEGVGHQEEVGDDGGDDIQRTCRIK